MNVQVMRLRFHLLKQNIGKIWTKIRKDEVDQKNDQSRVMTQEEKLDEELRETFPASDPPGHFSKSMEDWQIR